MSTSVPHATSHYMLEGEQRMLRVCVCCCPLTKAKLAVVATVTPAVLSWFIGHPILELHGDNTLSLHNAVLV